MKRAIFISALWLFSCLTTVASDSLHFKKIADFPKNIMGNTTQVESLVEYNSQLIFATRAGIYKISKKSQIESFSNGITGNKAATHLVIFENTLYASFQFNGIYKLGKDNKTWLPVKKGLSDSVIFSMSVCNGKLFAAGYDSKLFEWNSKEDKWETIEGTVRGIVSCACNNNVLLMGTNGNSIYRYNIQNRQTVKIAQLFKPDNYNGETIGFGVLAMSVHANNIYASVHTKGTYYSSDQGKTWETSPIPFTASFLENANDHIIGIHAGEKTGLYVLDTETLSFNPLVTSLNEKVVFMCIAGDRLIIATIGRLYELSLSKLHDYFKK